MVTRLARQVVPALLALALGSSASAQTQAVPVPCQAVLGTWRWFTGGVVTIKADGTITHEPGNDGTWQCADPARNGVTLRWRVGGFVNRLVPSGDGRALRSTDPAQSYVTAARIAGVPQGSRAPAAPPPAQSPRRTAATQTPEVAPAKPVDAAKPVTTAKPAETVRPAQSSGGLMPSNPNGIGPCAGNACTGVRIEIIAGCVWLRNLVDDVVQAEIQLATETIRMTLERPDLAKAAVRARGGESRTAHVTIYDPLTARERAVFNARVDRAGGCVANQGEIRSYRLTRAGVPDATVARVIGCTGDACADVDRSPEQVRQCRLANRGQRAIAVGIARPGNSDVSISGVLPPGGTMSLQSFSGCTRLEDIGRIEARYR